MHYPPYTSKWNPIEHRVFPHITRAIEGVPLNTVDDVKNKIELTKTKTGLTVVVDIIKKLMIRVKKLLKTIWSISKLNLENPYPS